MTTDIRDLLKEIDPEILIADGFDNAIVGIASRCGSPDVLAYDVDKCIAALVLEQGMDEEEAMEHFSFNVEGAYLGKRTPIFIRPLHD